MRTIKSAIRTGILLTVCLLQKTPLLAQSPQLINYQAVARNSSGQIISGQAIGVQISVLDGSPSGTELFRETHKITTTALGLFTLQIGSGAPQNGSFASIPWEKGSKYFKVEIDPAGGTAYVNVGTMQIVSVPYALYANSAGSALNLEESATISLKQILDEGATKGQVLKWNGSQWVPDNDVGGGNGDNWGTQSVITDATLSGTGVSGNALKIAQNGATTNQVLAWNGSSWKPTALADNSSTNEIQTLTIKNDTIYLSSGGFVKIPFSAFSWKTNGNSGVGPTGFIGTTDNQPLRLKSNNINVGNLSEKNVYVGKNAGDSTSGFSNVFIGNNAGMRKSTVTNTVAIGDSALYTNTGQRNTAIGSKTLFLNSTGIDNTAVGANSLKLSSQGNENSAFGSGSLLGNSIGNRNSAFGRDVLHNNKTGNNNSALGWGASFLNTTGDNNTALGAGALYNNYTGKANVAIGYGAAFQNTVDNNIAIGNVALYSQVKISNTVAIGDSALFNNGKGATGIQGLNNTAIGSRTLLNNSKGYENTAVGSNVLRSNTGGFGNSGFGNAALLKCTDGFDNTAIGNASLYSALSSYSNTAVGAYSLYSCKDGSCNTAIGYYSLNKNKSGNCNVAVGLEAMSESTMCYDNVAIGKQAMIYTDSGENNIGIGTYSMAYNKGSENIALGYGTMGNSSHGNNNIAIGALSLYNATNSSSNIAIGFYANGSDKATSTMGIGNWTLQYNNRSHIVAIGDSALYANGQGATQAVQASKNTAVGSKALAGNKTGFGNTGMGYQVMLNNNSGSFNTAFGTIALASNTTANSNTAVGYGAMYGATTGGENIALGYLSLNANTTGGGNTAIGVNSLLNSNANDNTAVGIRTLYTNTSGVSNAAVGNDALYLNTSGSYNAALGNNSGSRNTTGTRNTYVGGYAGNYITTGSYNLRLGYDSYNSGEGAWSNSGMIGYATLNPGGSNVYRIGNSSVTGIGGQVGWTTVSDQRIKEEIRENIPGLDFITRLRPVSYKYNVTRENKLMDPNRNDTFNWNGKYDIENIRFSGFLAQEVDSIAKSIGYDFSGVDRPKTENGLYGIRYAEFTVPLVRAVQEQQVIIQKQQDEIEMLKAQYKEILERLAQSGNQ